MSLFIGNLARDINERDLEEEFDRIGPCTLRVKGNYAFVEYKDEKDADSAIKELNDKDIQGQRISVQYSKKSTKYNGPRDGDRDRRPPRREGDRPSGGDKVCYNCNKPGHFARECRERRRSRSRSGDRDRSRGGFRGGFRGDRGGFRGGDRGGYRGGRDFGGDRERRDYGGDRDRERRRSPPRNYSRSRSPVREERRRSPSGGDRRD